MEFNSLYFGTAAFLALLLFSPEGYPAGRDPLSGEVIYEDVKYYSGLGHHRTATAVDQATSRWLQDRLKEAGFSTQVQEWNVRQFFPRETFIEIGRVKRIEAFPVWWPKSTGDQGIIAKQSSDVNAVRGKSYLFKNVTGPGFSVDNNLITQILTASGNGALAVILATYPNRSETLASDEFIGLNAMQTSQAEWPIPVVMVRARDFVDLEKALSDDSEVRVVSTGEYNQAALGLNVIGSLLRGPENKTILVTTPSSGWFTCAGERGAGIGIWLALAEWASKKTTRTNWIFAATSGHELRGLGTEHFLNAPWVPPPAKLHLWTHIGAWQAMYHYIKKDGQVVRTAEMSDKIIQYTGNSLAEAVNAAFGDPGLKVRIVPRIMFGDLTQALQHGYGNLAGISFGHGYHHSTQDLPEVTGPELLEPITQAYQKFLQAVTGE
jgi:hypothetical protein